jgi:PAS domain S-box-containing protein
MASDHDPFARLRELSEPGAILDPELLANLIEALPDAIFVVDAKAVIRLVNAAAELLFGYHRGDLHGHAIHMLLPPDLREKHAAHVQRFFMDPRPRPMGFGLMLKGQHRNGQDIPLEINLNPIMTRQGLYAVAAVRRRRDDAGT